MRKRIVSLASVVALLGGCSDALPGDGLGDSPSEPVGQIQQGVESALEKKPVAAIFVPAPNLAGYIWIFARGLNNKLYRRIYSLDIGWVENWYLLDSGIADIPSVALYGTGPEFGLVLYARGTDNHLWELYYPNATDTLGSGSWFDVSASVQYNGSSFGTIKGAPAVAVNDFELTVFAHRASDERAYSIDWAGSWTARIITEGQSPIWWTGVQTFAVDSNSNLFFGRRGRYSHENEAALFDRWSNGVYSYQPIVGDYAHNGTMAIDVLKASTFKILAFGRNGTQSLTMSMENWDTDGWENYGTCLTAGSPSIGRQQSSKVRFPYYVGTNGKLVASKNGSSCSTYGGSLKSSPTVVPVPLASGAFLDIVFYKGSNNNVWWFWQDGSFQQHSDLGLALP